MDYLNLFNDIINIYIISINYLNNDNDDFALRRSSRSYRRDSGGELAIRYFADILMIFYALQYLSTVNLGFKGGVGSELRMYQGNTPKELFQIHSSTTRPKNPSYSISTTV